MSENRSGPVTVPSVRASKRRDGSPPLVMVTAYDAPGARIADAAGVDIVLVGDSVANNVLGYEHTFQVTIEDMATTPPRWPVPVRRRWSSRTCPG